MESVWNFISPEPWSFGELFEALRQAPMYHIVVEIVLIVFIIRLLLTKSYPIESNELTEAEKEELIQDWEPEPLVPYTPEDHPDLKPRVVTKQSPTSLVVNGKEGINMATLNFLGMIGRKETEEAGLKAAATYGVGSCGPRGFYGTIDVHLFLEEKLAQFFGVEQAILYSYGFSTVASAIPAYAKRGDIIYCDEGVSFPIQMGLLASRSKLKFFKQNDMDDLQRLLEDQESLDKKNPKKAKVTRKFLVVEGLYGNYGTIVPIAKLIEFKYKYKVRIFMDESYSFGVLGATGRGVTEYANVKIEDVDLITISMEMALGTMGGFCLGTQYVIDHQSLCGLGYCFSASLPPLLASAAHAAIDCLEEDPGMCERLRNKASYVHEKLNQIDGITVSGALISPVKHVRLAESIGDIESDKNLLQSVVDKALDRGLVLSVAKYLEDEESFLPPPSIRVTVNTELTEEMLDKGVSILKDLLEEATQASS
ncbi:serine palmitoyltransferase 1-like [Apostichopus japonicus]|uniref:serine palmitoyltransferase 1-like n=1 Tax=Stichopus japonicus TaxID=307972 RepID=UPI003AB552D0